MTLGVFGLKKDQPSNLPLSIPVDVMPDLCHGFLNLKFVGKNVSHATMFVGQKINEMFETVDARRKL